MIRNMAEPYLTDLRELADQWLSVDAAVGALECRHFFAGAAAYRDGTIVASLTPVGLAFKVPAEVHDNLLSRGSATSLRYFPSAPIKRNYVLFPTGTTLDAGDAARLLRGKSLDAK